MTPIEWLAIALVTITSSARITRLITFDSFPPSIFVRNLWDRITNDGPWALLVHCAYCMSFWITLAVMGSGWASNWHPAWWFVNGAFGASYLAAILMVHDGDND